MASIKRHASAEWQGSGKDGKGSLTTQSATLKDTPYSFNARFGDGKGTNPEELIAAAHAGCFSMALSNELGSAGFTPESIRTSAVVTIDKTAAGFAITSVHLDVTAKVPGASQQAFEAAANAAKSGCPVSKVLKAEITMDARLET
jgi:osmotically inducible protein OsmC